MKSLSAPTTATVDEVTLLAVADLWERARLADQLATQLQVRAAAALRVRRDAVRALHRLGVKQCVIAHRLSMTPTRINQLIAVRTSRTNGVVAA